MDKLSPTWYQTGQLHRAGREDDYPPSSALRQQGYCTFGGCRWAAIASYLPQRTDNDIKNYWNTHLKKRLKKQEEGQDGQKCPSSQEGLSSNSSLSTSSSSNKGQWERRLQTDIQMAKQALCEALSIDKLTTQPGPTKHNYASCADNIARLLESWMVRNKPPSSSKFTFSQEHSTQNYHSNKDRLTFGFGSWSGSGSGSGSALSSTNDATTPVPGFDSIFSFNANSNSNSEPVSVEESKPRLAVAEQAAPLSLLEKWLFEEGVISHESQEHGGLLDISMDDDIAPQLF
ncbi:hypothetical protein Cgig2_008522 [Carnegiea gigantea]|uniref:Uncharacterized protein n=1 Tax=Carnegiea gigantea TaxID=171969 RepID=A0A9Q1JSF6_9CARY|nr:hypothetical protein Cgig2_008522 [Carnegiea gigantea]